MVKRRTVVFIGLALSVWAILATGLAGYYYLRFEDTLRAFHDVESSIIEVDFVIDYGNGTATWHNGTQLIAGSTAFDALLAVTTDVQYKSHSFGKLITSINGKEEKENSGWIWFYWDTEGSAWDYSLVAIDQHILHPDDMLRFEFTSW
ncbi:MAG: DUF4430 domain-containing protein [Candidatus Bathyarchaeota archaeon]|nr:MAG: DUF4430 domain-containing protein [Candidatus Bathyarchaeota archaeon]